MTEGAARHDVGALRLGGRSIPILSGLVLALAYPPFDLFPLAFVGLTPLLYHIATLPPGEDGRRAAARAGFLFGISHFSILLYWLVVALIWYTPLAILAFLGTVLVLGVFYAGFAVALRSSADRTPVPFALSAAILWTTAEWLQGHLGDLSFPWLGLGTTLAVAPRVAGAADLIGARGLTFWLALVNGLLTVLLLARRGQQRVRLGVLLAAVILVPLGYGFWRADSLMLRPVTRVAVIQPNIPEDLKLDRSRALDSSLVALTNLTQQVADDSVGLVVWPEVALPALLEGPYESFLLERVQQLSEEVGAPMVVGAYGSEELHSGDLSFFNSAFLVTGAGIIESPYHKQYLVPFVERVPFVNPRFLERFTGDLRYFGGLGRGLGSPAIALREGAFGVLICYESIFAPLGRRYRLAGADFLVNMTNDAWYGREPWYARTTALWQHPAHLPMRAVELRVGVARAANTGISLFVDPLGRVYEATNLFEPDVRVATVFTTDVLTLYARWGDWLATSAALAGGLLVLASWLGGRAARRTSASSADTSRGRPAVSRKGRAVDRTPHSG